MEELTLVERKRSRQSMDLSAIDCCQCKRTARQVFQCPNGHIVCGPCAKTKKSCNVCGVEYGSELISGEKLALELLLGTRRMPCPYQPYGCEELVFNSDLPAHVEACGFGQVEFCKVLQYDCSKSVTSAKTLIEHLKEHMLPIKESRLNQQSVKLIFKHSTNQDQTWVKLFEHDKHTFLISVLKHSTEQGELLKLKTFYLGDELEIEDLYYAQWSIKNESKVQVFTWREPLLNYRAAAKMQISGVPIPYFLIQTSILASEVDRKDTDLLTLDVVARLVRRDGDNQERKATRTPKRSPKKRYVKLPQYTGHCIDKDGDDDDL